MRTLATLAIVLAGCRGVLGIPDDSRVATVTVSVVVAGTVDATDEPVRVFLTDSLSEMQELVVDADGERTFPRPIENGGDWTITASPGCEVHGGAGQTFGVPIVVEVACDGYLGLVDFGFSAPVETVATGATFETYGSLLTQHTTIVPQTTYPSPDVAATVLHDNVPVPGTGLDVADGDDITVVVDASAALPQLVQRAYATTLSLTGPPAQFAALAPDPPTAVGHHGAALDAFADLLLVGSPDASDGRATLYIRRGRQWTRDHVFEAPAPGGAFGASVAVADGHVVIGAPDLGRAYLYTRGATGWELAATLDGGAGTRAGAAVAIEKSASPAYVVVGAPGASSDRGVASVYDLTGALHATLAAPGADAAIGDELGTSVAIGLDHVVVVGAPGDSSTSRSVVDEGYPASGAAYVFDAAAGGTPPATKIKPALVGAGDRFGSSVAIAAGLVVVGAPLESSGASAGDNTRAASGAVYVFSGGATYPTELYLKAPSPDAGDNFGTAVALRAAAGLQSEHVLVVGAPYEDGGTPGVVPGDGGDPDDTVSDAGAVYVLALDALATDGTFAAYLKASATGVADHFGAALALTPESLLVGAPGTDAQVGAGYSFR